MLTQTSDGVVVPACRGFTVISAMLPCRGEDGVIYSEEPVIAFRFGHDGAYDGPMPITASGEPSKTGGTRWTVQWPNGACYGPGHAYVDVDAFKVECEREAAGNGSAA